MKNDIGQIVKNITEGYMEGLEKGKNTLLNCPFCGQKPDKDQPSYFPETPEQISVQCWKCDAEGPVKTTDKAAIKAWNMRSYE